MRSYVPFLKDDIQAITEKIVEFDIWATLQLTLPLLRDLRSLAIDLAIFSDDVKPFSSYIASTLATPSPAAGQNNYLERAMCSPLSAQEELDFYADRSTFISSNLIRNCGLFMALPRIQKISMYCVYCISWTWPEGLPPSRVKLLSLRSSVLAQDVAKSMIAWSEGPCHILMQGWGENEWVRLRWPRYRGVLEPSWHMYRLEDCNPSDSFADIYVEQGVKEEEDFPAWTKTKTEDMSNAFKQRNHGH